MRNNTKEHFKTAPKWPRATYVAIVFSQIVMSLTGGCVSVVRLACLCVLEDVHGQQLMSPPPLTALQSSETWSASSHFLGNYT